MRPAALVGVPRISFGAPGPCSAIVYPFQSGEGSDSNGENPALGLGGSWPMPMIPCVPVALSSTATPPNDLTAPNEIGFAVVALGTPWIVNDPVAVLPVTLPETPKPPKTRILGEIFARRPTAFRMIMS